MNLFEMKKQRQEALSSAEAILAKTEGEKREMTAAENTLFKEHMEEVGRFNKKIQPIEDANTLTKAHGGSLINLVDMGSPRPDKDGDGYRVLTPGEGKAQAAYHVSRFNAWLKNRIASISGQEQQPEMGATAPGGAVSIATGTGLDSIGFAIPTEVMPFLKSYLQFSPFEKAGASIVSTDHMRPVKVPVLSAGAVPSEFAEGAGPVQGVSGSQPMGLSGFTMGANKYSRQVIADYEALQSTEVPLSPLIIDELLVAIANVVTQNATTALYNAFTAPSGVSLMSGSSALAPPLQIGPPGLDQYGQPSVQADNYGQMMALRHALVEGFEDPNECYWMLSRNTLATIRNTRASTSGVVMFDANADLILGRPYVVNEFFDSICGAGFVAYGNWRRGAWLRRTPILTRVLQELYWVNNQWGFICTTWSDDHFLAELVGAAQPPTHQPCYYTILPSGSLP